MPYGDPVIIGNTGFVKSRWTVWNFSGALSLPVWYLFEPKIVRAFAHSIVVVDRFEKKQKTVPLLFIPLLPHFELL